MAVLGIGRTAEWRSRATYLQGGLELTVCDVARSGRSRQYDTNAKGHVTALACSTPPQGPALVNGRARTAAARQQPRMSTVSRETVRRMLKKRDLKPWRRVMWCIGALTQEYRSRTYN